MHTDKQFDRQDTKAIKGTAVLMMLFLHLVSLADRYPATFEGFVSVIPDLSGDGYFIRLITSGMGFCVPLFFFLGGYGLYMRMQKSGFSLWQSILKLYKAYWKVFFIFVPVGIVFFSRSGESMTSYAARFGSYGMMETVYYFITDALGLSCRFNGEWWFFSEYVCILLWGYLFCKYTRRNRDLWIDVLTVILIDALIRSVIPQLPELTLFATIKDNLLYAKFLRFNTLSVNFFAGIVMAKHNGISRLKELLSRLPCHLLLCVVLLGAMVFLRTFTMAETVDIVLSGLWVAALSLILDAWKPLKKLFGYFGKHSTNMWLIHSFYCYYYLEVTYLVYSTRSMLVDFCILTALSLGSSILVDWFYAKAFKLIAGKKTVPAAKN